MLYFSTDYMRGAHPEVMAALMDTNMVATPGYGEDDYCRRAERKILEECGIRDGKVYFLEGGTQTNMLVITRLLDYCDGVIAADTGHINVHESGAIEAAGHKVISLPSEDGKIKATDINRCLSDYYGDDTYPHIVRPGMVYITFPTEMGTLYTLGELEDISETCRKWDITLYIDGARLAYGLAAEGNDVTLKDLARLCDAFYIGGTKCGALFGEAVVTRRPELFKGFFSLCKQRGAVLSKGRLLGIQFETLFNGNLYGRIGQHAIETAMLLKDGFRSKGYRMLIDSPTNQQFFILPNEIIERLQENVAFELWGPMRKDGAPVRFVTDWSTRREDIIELMLLL